MATVLDDLQLAGNTYLDDLDSLNLGYITGNGALSNPLPTLSSDGEVEKVSVDATLDGPVPVVVGVGERILWTRGAPVPLFAPAATFSGVGGLQRDGSGAVSGTVPTLTGVAERELPGSGSVIGSKVRAAGVGAIKSVGSGTLDASIPTVSSTGTVSETRTGSGALDAIAATAFGFGNVGTIVGAAGTLDNYPATLSGTGVIIKFGSGTLDAGSAFVTATGSVGVSQTNDADVVAVAASVDSAGYITRKIAATLQSPAAATTGTVIIEGASAGAGTPAPRAAFLSCLGLVITAPTAPVDFPTDHIAIVTPNSNQFYTTAITGQVNQQENFSTVGSRMGNETGVIVDLSGVISNPRYFLFELVCNDSTWAGGIGPLGGTVGIELTVLYNNELTRIASFTPSYESIYLLNYPSDRTRFYAVKNALTAGSTTFYLGGYETVATRSYGLDFPDTGSLNVIIDQ